MGCKHEGGTDPCEVYTSNGTCKVATAARNREYYINNREKALRAKADALVRKGRGDYSEYSRIGYTNELLAAADLNKRCGLAYLNPVPQTKHDVFAKTSLGWRTVQVKTAKLVRTKNGIAMYLGTKRSRAITSEIIALIDDFSFRVRYISNNGKPLPPEIPAEPAAICKDVILLNNPEEL